MIKNAHITINTNVPGAIVNILTRHPIYEAVLDYDPEFPHLQERMCATLVLKSYRMGVAVTENRTDRDGTLYDCLSKVEETDVPLRLLVLKKGYVPYKQDFELVGDKELIIAVTLTKEQEYRNES